MNQTSKIARKFKVSTRTVRNWKSQGAPISDPGRLKTWLAARRQPPRFAAKARKVGKVGKAAASKPAQPLPDLGAAHALKRLEECEGRDYQALQSAIVSGDDLQIRLARDRWLRTSEGLRRYDLAVEQNRREAGELLPRVEVARMLKTFAQAVHHGLMGGFESLCPELAAAPDPYRVWGLIHKTVKDAPLAVAAGLRLYSPALPEALVADFIAAWSVWPQDDTWAQQFAGTMRDVMAVRSEGDLERWRAKADVERRWRECTDPAEKSRIWHQELNLQPDGTPYGSSADVCTR